MSLMKFDDVVTTPEIIDKIHNIVFNERWIKFREHDDARGISRLSGFNLT